MEKERKFYARYYIIRGQKALWKGGPAEHGSQYRNIVITSNQFTSTQGKFQVKCEFAHREMGRSGY